MRKLYNIRWDRRTLYNVLKLPFIISIRVPVITLVILAQYIEDNGDVIEKYLPGWDSK